MAGCGLNVAGNGRDRGAALRALIDGIAHVDAAAGAHHYRNLHRRLGGSVARGNPSDSLQKVEWKQADHGFLIGVPRGSTTGAVGSVDFIRPRMELAETSTGGA